MRLAVSLMYSIVGLEKLAKDVLRVSLVNAFEALRKWLWNIRADVVGFVDTSEQ